MSHWVKVGSPHQPWYASKAALRRIDPDTAHLIGEVFSGGRSSLYLVNGTGSAYPLGDWREDDPFQGTPSAYTPRLSPGYEGGHDYHFFSLGLHHLPGRGIALDGTVGVIWDNADRYADEYASETHGNRGLAFMRLPTLEIDNDLAGVTVKIPRTQVASVPDLLRTLMLAYEEADVVSDDEEERYYRVVGPMPSRSAPAEVLVRELAQAVADHPRSSSGPALDRLLRPLVMRHLPAGRRPLALLDLLTGPVADVARNLEPLLFPSTDLPGLVGAVRLAAGYIYWNSADPSHGAISRLVGMFRKLRAVAEPGVVSRGGRGSVGDLLPDLRWAPGTRPRRRR